MFICEGQLKCFWGSSFMMPKWSLMGVHLDACKSLKMEGWKGFCLYKNIDHMSIITQISFYMVQKIITQNLLLLQLEFFLAIRWTPDFTCVFFFFGKKIHVFYDKLMGEKISNERQIVSNTNSSGDNWV